jgi:hypothetical protein
VTPFPREGLRAWFATLTGLAAGNVIFEDEPEPIIGPNNAGVVTGLLHVNMTSSVSMSWEERRKDAPGTTGPATPPGTPNAQIDTIEQTYVTLGLVYESYAPATTALAYDMLAKVRARGFQPPNLDLLRLQGCFLVSVGNVNTVLNRSVDNRALSVAALDVKISHTQIDTYLDDFIEEVVATGTIGTVDASFDIAVPIQAFTGQVGTSLSYLANIELGIR